VGETKRLFQNKLIDEELKESFPQTDSVDKLFEGSDDRQLNKNVFIPNWNNRPPQLPPVIQLGGTTILTSQNVSALIARPGGGKSSCIEAIISSFVNPISDCLGFSVDKSCAGIISLDFERTNNDVWNSWHRAGRRAEINQGETMPNVLIAGMRSVSRLKERKEFTVQMLENNPCSLLMFDGAGDLVNDTNDLEEAGLCMDWLREMTVKYNISVFCTLHPNPGSDKPRGHLGSEICREAECVMMAKPYDENSRIITCRGGEPMKNRNNPELTVAFKWSERQSMFIAADFDEISNEKKSEKDGKKRAEMFTVIKKVLPLGKSLTAGELVSAIMSEKGYSDKTTRERVKDAVGWGLVEHDGKYYRAKTIELNDNGNYGNYGN
jgi:hypothetical protein